jgi:hypothetical protein
MGWVRLVPYQEARRTRVSLYGLRVTVWGKTGGVCNDFPQGLLVEELVRTEHGSEGP